MTQCYQYKLRNGKLVRFFANPLNRSSEYHFPKPVDPALEEILLNPESYKDLHPINSGKKIFLGFGTSQPSSNRRFPIWIDSKLLFSHILIGGSIGSGKSTMTARLLAGALNCGFTAIIGEAKGGIDINPKRTAFSMLTVYLSRRLNVKLYRWPRGNCYFNPLLCFNNLSERQTFMHGIARQIEAEGEMQAYIYRAADIAAYILELLETISMTPEIREQVCTLRKLIDLLKKPEELEKVIEAAMQQFAASHIKAKIQEIFRELERLNFFSLKMAEGRKHFVMTAGGINFFADVFNEENLLFYSEPHAQDQYGNQLVKLEMEDILYQQALVVISQPLAANHPSADIVGPIFWDALLSETLQLGIFPSTKNGKARCDIVAFLDETHRLPTGRLGNSGDFLREYKLSLVEITPAVLDEERWNQNKHVYQTIISTSPGVPEICQLMHDRLPPKFREPFDIGIDLKLSKGELIVSPKFIDNREQCFNYGDTGVSTRSLRSTGKYTALLYTDASKNPGGMFWLDLESTILSELNNFLEEANAGDQAAAKVVDYTLGLLQEFVQ